MAYQFDQRSSTPPSRGGETFAMAAGAVCFGAAAAALVGLGMSAALLGGGWVWPPHGTVDATVLGILRGQPAQALPPAVAHRLPALGGIYGCIAAVEIAYMALAGFVGVVIFRYRRPSDARSGMATRSQAAQALGLRQLLSVKDQIRPDLYPPRRKASR